MRGENRKSDPAVRRRQGERRIRSRRRFPDPLPPPHPATTRNGAAGLGKRAAHAVEETQVQEAAKALSPRMGQLGKGAAVSRRAHRQGVASAPFP